ncbi:uncharacterized protein [Apostichopus japonicus]|uniref:uncharacterized protein n=1 Tax=Stichopus japonicus TaxID=307972 RepID=UPI003AB6F427
MEKSQETKLDNGGKSAGTISGSNTAPATEKMSSSNTKKESERQKTTKERDEQDTFSPCVFGKTKLWIPQELKNSPGILREIVSMKTWEDVLTSEERSALSKHLPTFTENNGEEQKETLRRLFEGENFRYGNPLEQFEQDLSMGRFGVDSVEKQRAWQRLQREECQLQNSHRLQTMLPEVLIKRQELLEVVQFTSPSEYIKKPQQDLRKSKLDSQEKEKYEMLLEDLSKELGESMLSDEEMENGLCSDEEDAFQLPWEDRFHRLFDSPSKIPHCTLTRKPSSSEVNGAVKEENPVKPEFSLVTEEDYMMMLERMQIVKEDAVDHPEFIFSHITLRDIINRTYPVKIRSQEEANALKRKRKKEKEELKSKKKKKTPTTSPKPSTPVSVISSQDSFLGMEVPSSPESTSISIQQEPVPVVIKQEETQPPPPPPPPPPAAAAVVNVTNALPQGSPEVHNKVQYQVPHSFFALLRKYFNIAMNHQLWVSELQERVSIWEKSPVSVLCPWRPLQLSWSKVVENTLYFLSLEEQGKVVRYLEEEDAWVWPDPMSVANDHLTMLFKRWLDLMLRVQPVVSPMACKDGTLVIPEPRMYTEYTVRSSSEEEIGQFQTQELQRFSEPQKPFTYCQHGYESVVGPVKGITPMDPLPASKGREHSLLISDRPSYVTILSLVRDAVARLPNGEGTKLEICHLLKESQYIAPNADANLLAAVSGALDRLHNEKDPSVKFDATRKLWVYLHRNRTMKDFERIQMEQIMALRTKKASSKPKQGSQMRVAPLDYSADLTTSGSESSSPSFDLSNRSSPGNARSLSPRVLPHSPRSNMTLAQTDAKDQTRSLVTGINTSQALDRSFSGITPGTAFPDTHIDPNISTIQSLISESLIKSQLMKKPYQRSKTPPASLGRRNTSSGSVAKRAQLLSTGGVQRSMSIPASWPHLTQSAAGDLIHSDVLLSQTSAKPTARKDHSRSLDAVMGSKKTDFGSKMKANSPRSSSSEKKSSLGVKSKTKGEKSKSSKSSSSEKKSPTVQLKSGAITVTLPSSALKGQTVRSILASAASITKGNTTTQQGEEQSHPTVQAVRKRLMAEKNQGSKTKLVKQPEVKLPGPDSSDQGGHAQPQKVDPKRAAIPTIILRPTTSSYIGQTTAVSKDGAVSPAQISAQSLALVGAKPSGVITGIATSQVPTSKQLPLSLVVSGASSKATPSVSKPTPYIQQGNIPIPSLAPGQNIILQMPDGSKFMTSIPAGAATATATISTKKSTATKLSKPGPVGSGVNKGAAIGVLQPTTVVTAHQNKHVTTQQGRIQTSTASFHNPYEFDDDQDLPRPVLGKSFLATSGIIKSHGQNNPIFTVAGNPNQVQRVPLNLATKQGSPGRKQANLVTSGSHVGKSTSLSLTQAGLVRGTLSPTGPLRGTIIQTGPLKGAAMQTGISMGAVSQASLLKGVGQTGMIKGVVSHPGMLKGTTMTQTGLLKATVSQPAMVKGSINPQTRLVKTSVSHSGLMKGTTSSQRGNFKTAVLPQSNMIKGVMTSQSGKMSATHSTPQQVNLSRTITVTAGNIVSNAPGQGSQVRSGSLVAKPASQDTSTGFSRTDERQQVVERCSRITEANRDTSEVRELKAGNRYRLVDIQQTPTSLKNSVERIPSNTQATVRTGQLINRNNPRGSAVVPAGRMSYRPHSSPGILRKTQDPSRKLHVNRPAMRVTKSVSTGASNQQQTVKAEMKFLSGGGENQSGDLSVTSGKPTEMKTTLQQNRTFTDKPKQQDDVKKTTGIMRNSLILGSDSTMGEMEGKAKTAKLIKSQELAEAVSGDMSKQGGQEQT